MFSDGAERLLVFGVGAERFAVALSAVDAKNGFWVNGVQVEKNDLGTRVKSVLEEKTERIVLIKGDTDASYSSIMYAMDDLRKAGIENIGLITEPKTPVNPNAGGK